MKSSADEVIFKTGILQALQKNKVIQSKLADCQHVYYIQLVKDLQNYDAQEKYNRELLYAWKKESYVRQFRKKLQHYERQRFGARDEYYENQLRSLENLISGQQTLVVPPSEEQRRLDINAKYHQFLKELPLQNSPMPKNKAPATSVQHSEVHKHEDLHAQNLKETWKHISLAQSARPARPHPKDALPRIHRSLTQKAGRRQGTSAKADVSSARITAPDSSRAQGSEFKSRSYDERLLQTPKSPGKTPLNNETLADGMEPLVISTESLEKYVRADLLTIRSVRRPKKNPSDLNLIFETRKQIYHINKHALDVELARKKIGLPKAIRIHQLEQTLPSEEKSSPPTKTNGNTEQISEQKQ